MYESDITQFIRQLKRDQPEIEGEQKKGRAIWWDKEPLDLDEARRLREALVPQQPYVYQTK